MDGELESIRLEPADNGFTVHVSRHRKEGKRDEAESPPRNKPKIASDPDSALAIIAKEIGAKGRKRRGKGLVVVNEGDSSPTRGGRKARRKGAARKRVE